MGDQEGMLKHTQRRESSGWQSRRLLARGMLKCVLRRLVRIIVVNGPVVRVMVIGSLSVLDFMRNVPAASRSQPLALRRERVQGQQKQQEDANESTHEEVLFKKSSRYYSHGF